jgi:hypothetical protein
MDDFKPSEEQQEIIDTSKQGDSFVVKALAGTGKTTTLKQICKASPERNYLYVCFNKTVAKDFKTTIKKEKIDNVVARTSDSVARNYIHNTKYVPYGLNIGSRLGGGLYLGKDIFKHLKFEPLKLLERPDPYGRKPQESVILNPSELVKYIKKGVVKFCISTDTEILDRHFDDYEASSTALEYANRLWQDYLDPYGVVKLTFEAIFKMFAMDKPSMKTIYDPRNFLVFDALLIDEAQDTNPIAGEQYKDQTDMQIIYVGDRNQAIYGFRGAEDEMEKRSDLKTYTLTQCWRFGSQIAWLGNVVLKKLDSPHLLEGKAPYEGVITEEKMEKPDVIVCRTNVGCLNNILSLLEDGEKVKLDNKTKEDIEKIVSTLGYLAGQLPRPKKIDEDLQEYENIEEVYKAIKDDKLPQKYKILIDIVMDEDKDTEIKGAEKLLKIIEPLSLRGKSGAQVITVHRAKGGEWDRVQLGNDFFGPKWNSYEEKVIPLHRSELMLIYVAVTRARKEIAITKSISHIFETEEETYQRLKSQYESHS